jgi:hypothetical protein
LIEQTEDHMLTHTARTRAWLADLAAINADIETQGLPAPRPVRKRARKLKPLWEE